MDAIWIHTIPAKLPSFPRPRMVCVYLPVPSCQEQFCFGRHGRHCAYCNGILVDILVLIILSNIARIVLFVGEALKVGILYCIIMLV